MTTDFPTAPSAYGLNGPSAAVTVEKSPHASHTEILTLPIKETQLDLFGTRASCHRFLANWLRVMFSALAYTLMQRLRELALANTELAKASAATIRVRLLKIGAAVLRNTRRIRILLASHHPLRDVYFMAANTLASP